jgi:two-component system, sensor histidine kinase
VLIVDDNLDAAESLAELARSWGHCVSVAHTGTAAVKLAAEVEPEIALIDIGLPDFDGYELARQLRANPKHCTLRLAALTGYGRAEDRAAALAAGFDVHLVKPAEMDELEKLIAGTSLSAG